MVYPAHYSRFEKLFLWYGSKPIWLAAILGSLFITAFSLISLIVVVLIVNSHEISRFIIIGLPLFAYIFVILTITFALVTPRLHKRLDTVLDATLTARDRMDLAAWVRTGIKPENGALHAKLGTYLDYLEPIINGSNIFAAYGDRRKIFQKIVFGFFAAAFLLYVVIFITDSHSRGQFNTYLQPALMLYFLYIYNPFSNKPKRLYTLLGNRNMTRIRQRRAELTAPAG